MAINQQTADDDLDAILRRIVAERRDDRVVVSPFWIAAAAMQEIERSPTLMRHAALARLRGRACEIMGLRRETVAEAAARLRRERAAPRRLR